MVATAKKEMHIVETEVDLEVVETKRLVTKTIQVNVTSHVPGVLLAKASQFAAELAEGLWNDDSPIDRKKLREGLLGLQLQLGMWSEADGKIEEDDWSFLTDTFGEKA